MKQLRSHWLPAVILLVGALGVQTGVRDQKRMPLREPLASAVPAHFDGYTATDIEISENERRVAGMSSYVMRAYAVAGAAQAAFTLYVGYYERQEQGKTIHSPKNCLPGGGWEPILSSRETISTAQGEVPVNRYVLQRGKAQALVLYWYQGRGRVQANEYRVKWELLRDQALRGRSDEALVRIVVPITTTEAEAYRTAIGVARRVLPAVDRALAT